MRLSSTLVTLVVSILFGGHSAYACSCVDGTESIKKFLEDKTVFSGIALDSRPSKKLHPLYGRRTVTTFTNSTFLLGKDVQTVTVEHNINGESCGLEFGTGTEHFVVAYNYENSRPLETDICTLGIADKSVIEDFLRTGIDRKTINREMCFMLIDHAYSIEAFGGEFELEDPECEFFIDKFNELYRTDEVK